MKQIRRRASGEAALQIVPLLVSGISVVLGVFAVVLAVGNRDLVIDVPVPEPSGWFVPIQIASALVWIAASLSLLQRRDLAWSRLAAIAALSHAAVAASYAWAIHGLVGGAIAPGASYAAGAALWLLAVEMPVSLFMLVSLPTGRLGNTGLDRLGRLAVGMATVGVVAGAVGVPDVAGTDFSSARSALGSGIPVGPLPPLLIAPASIIALVVLVAKWRRSRGADRLALRWVVGVQVLGTFLVIPLFALASPAVSVGVAQVVSALGVLVLVTVVRRQHVLGVERVFERTLRFVLLAGALTLVYAAVVAAGSEILGGGVRPLAAAVVALAVLPVRDRISAAVARFVYGNRANAAAIVSGVAERAANPTTPRELVEHLLHSLMVGTGCRGGTVVLDGFGEIATVGSGGEVVGVLDVPLRHRGAVIGRLTLTPAAGEVCLDPLAVRVAVEVAPHIALVSDAYRTDIELEQARVRLVLGREEERRRLRHDLHDGLGPILTGVAFSADAASNLVEADPARAAELIGAARREVSTALDEIRRIVEDLRPPALDELGLDEAIRQHAQHIPHLEVDVSGPVPAVELPAAVEVAAYRIAVEALTNVARHAGATRVAVDVRLNGNLELTVADNGTGSISWSPGVGLASMRDRARELGGDLTAGPGPEGGLVAAMLPMGLP